MSPQIPLALKFPTDQQFAAFVGQTALRDLVEAVAVANSPDWLFLSGPSGSGKTHLLLAACAEADGCGLPAVFLPMAALAGNLQDALIGPGEAGLDLRHGHPDLPPEHPHLRAHGAGAGHIHAFVIDDEHRVWPTHG